MLLCCRFLAENSKNKKAADKESSREKDASALDKDKEKGGGKSGELFNISAASFADSKEDKAVPFFDAMEEEFLKSHGLKESDLEDGEVKTTLTARDIFGKWGDEPAYPTAYPSFKTKSRSELEDEEAEEQIEEDLYRSRKLSSKKEEKAKKKEKKEKRRSPSSPAPTREKDRPLFPVMAREDSPPRHLSSSREEFELKISSLDDLPRFVEQLCSSRSQLVESQEHLQLRAKFIAQKWENSATIEDVVIQS